MACCHETIGLFTSGAQEPSIVCYSNIIMDKDSIETPPTPQSATSPQGEVPRSQDEATKSQDSTAKRRRLARLVDRLTWWQATAITAGVFVLPTAAAMTMIDNGVPLNGFFGIYNGSSLETAIFSLCLLAAPLSPLCALMFAAYFATRRKDLTTLKRMMPVALLACIFLVALLSMLLRSFLAI